jgi:hypothetical protein
MVLSKMAIGNVYMKVTSSPQDMAPKMDDVNRFLRNSQGMMLLLKEDIP